MKVVNTSDKPFELVFDSGYYPAIAPGAIVDLPDEIVSFAIRKSAIIDELGDTIGHRLEPLDGILDNAEKRAGLALFPCPLVATRECNAPNFRTIEELTTHMDEHRTPQTGKPNGKGKSDFRGV